MAQQREAASSKDLRDLRLLHDLWGLWSAEVQRVPLDAWSSTALGIWTTRELLAHLIRQFGVIDRMLAGAMAPGTAHVDYPTPAAYFANFRSWLQEASEHAARDAVEYSAAYSLEELMAGFDESDKVVDRLEAHLDHVLPTPFGTTTGRAYVGTRILEATVHLTDLQRASGLPVAVPNEASVVVVGILLDLTPRQEFIDAATGRREADFFPVLV